MLEFNYEFTQSVEELIQASVTSTISTLFKIPIDVCSGMGKVGSSDNYFCCGEFVQDDTKATLLFVFDRALIKKLTGIIFPADSVNSPGVCEATAAEIVNIVSNQLKTHLNVHGYKLHLGQPCMLDRAQAALKERPLIHMAFSLKNDVAMGVDFYLRSA